MDVRERETADAAERLRAWYTRGVTHSLPHAEQVEQAIAPLRASLLDHPIYAAVDSLERLRVFVADHVFAVWDFMALVKRLQRDLTCVEVLWAPPSDPFLARFINEVVLVEESDALPGGPTSHVELYRRAMDEVTADASAFDTYLTCLRRGVRPREALTTAEAPPHVRSFVEATLHVAEHGSTVEVLAAFLFGREDVIPDMFRRLLVRWHGVDTPAFALYLERHVTIDGEAHGPLARSALERLLTASGGQASVEQAVAAATQAIQARMSLWNGVHEAVLALP